MLAALRVRRERAADVAAARAIVGRAFAFTVGPGRTEPYEVQVLDELRADAAWLPALSWVAERDGVVVGHAVCSRAWVDGRPVVGLGPVAVLPEHQRSGVGAAIVYALVGAADVLGEPLVVLLGHTDYYPRFGFRPALELGVEPPEPSWGAHFQALPLTAYDPALRGPFRYPPPFN